MCQEVIELSFCIWYNGYRIKEKIGGQSMDAYLGPIVAGLIFIVVGILNMTGKTPQSSAL